MALFVLVMSQYDGHADEWLFSKSATSRADLEALGCYEDPPNSLPRADYIAVGSWSLRRPIGPCDRPSAPPVSGTIYLLQPNA
jgi:hypothetical protein